MSNLNCYTPTIQRFCIFYLHHSAVPSQRKAVTPLSSTILIHVYSDLMQFTLDTYTTLHMVEIKAKSGIPMWTPSALKRSSLKCVNTVWRSCGAMHFIIADLYSIYQWSDSLPCEWQHRRCHSSICCTKIMFAEEGREETMLQEDKRGRRVIMCTSRSVRTEGVQYDKVEIWREL